MLRPHPPFMPLSCNISLLFHHSLLLFSSSQPYISLISDPLIDMQSEKEMIVLLKRHTETRRSRETEEEDFGFKAPHR